MRRAVRFVIALVVALGLVAWVGSAIVHRTTRAWFEKDVSLRARLVVSGARQALIAHWHKEQRSELQGLLAEMAHDERIMAAAACAADLTLLTRTKDYPSQFGCADLGPHVRPTAESPGADWSAWRHGDDALRAATSTSAPSRCWTASCRWASWY